jgi:hypothetical protein
MEGAKARGEIVRLGVAIDDANLLPFPPHPAWGRVLTLEYNPSGQVESLPCKKLGIMVTVPSLTLLQGQA